MWHFFSGSLLWASAALAQPVMAKPVPEIAQPVMAQTAQADMQQAITAYQQQNFISAAQGFQQLLPLGNATAALNLALMALHGEGQTADPVQALALLLLAEQLGLAAAADYSQELKADLTAAQQQQATALLQRYQAQVRIPSGCIWLDATTALQSGQLLHRAAPKYPSQALRKGQAGLVRLQVLLASDGSIKASRVIQSVPLGVFDQAAIQAAQSSRFAPTAQPSLIELSYSFAATAQPAEVAARLHQQLTEAGWWQSARRGDPAMQYQLGLWLQHLWQFAMQQPRADVVAPLAGTLPPLALFTSANEFSLPKAADPTASLQDVQWLIIDAEQNIEATSVDASKAAALQPWRSQRFHAAEPGFYLQLPTTTQADQYQFRLQPVIASDHGAEYWLDLAARNGDVQAQQWFSAQADWALYLAEQGNDAKQQAWSATQQWLLGNTEVAKQLWQQAALGDAELVRQLQNAVGARAQ